MSTPKTTLLHLGTRKTRFPEDGPFHDGLARYADMTVIRDAEDRSAAEKIDLIRRHKVLLLMWGCDKIPDGLWDDPGALEYVLQVGGGCPKIFRIYDHGVVMTNWGDSPALNVAEGAMALLLTMLKDIPAQIHENERGGKHLPKDKYVSGTLYDLKLGIYGYGMIGRKFVEMVRPFEPRLMIYDPYAELPEDVERAESLEQLFDWSEAIAVHAAHTPETRHSVTADLLRRLPDHGLLISTVRNDVAVQEDVYAEIRSGRLRVALDVLAYDLPEPEPDDPIRQCENGLLTWHDISHYRWPPRPGQLSRHERVAIENLRRYVHGEPLMWVISRQQLERMT